MPFITLKSGTRINVAHIVSYSPAHANNGGGSWVEIDHDPHEDATHGPRQVDETPEELDTLIALASQPMFGGPALHETPEWLHLANIAAAFTMPGTGEDLSAIAADAKRPPAAAECRVCGCTVDHACEGGCSWAEPGLCSQCAGLLPQVPECHVAEIDAMPYQDMLERARFTEVGDPIFQRETGEYFMRVMQRKRRELGDAGHVAASKAIGWDRPAPTGGEI